MTSARRRTTCIAMSIRARSACCVSRPRKVSASAIRRSARSTSRELTASATCRYAVALTGNCLLNAQIEETHHGRSSTRRQRRLSGHVQVHTMWQHDRCAVRQKPAAVPTVQQWSVGDVERWRQREGSLPQQQVVLYFVGSHGAAHWLRGYRQS